MTLQTEDLSEADIAHALNMLESIDRVETLTEKVGDGTFSQEDFRLALLDGIITQDEYNELMGIGTDYLDKYAGETEGLRDLYAELGRNMGPVIEDTETMSEKAGDLTKDFDDTSLATEGLKLQVGELGAELSEVEGKYDIEIHINVTGDDIPDVDGKGKGGGNGNGGDGGGNGGGNGGGGDYDKPPPEFQYGGHVSPFQSYIVGERGPELFVPTTSGEIIPNNRLRRMNRLQGRQVTNVLNIYTNAPITAQVREFNLLRAWSRG
jgi:hypothetical protein